MRVLHLADVHLDRPFVGLPPHVAKRRRAELFETFRRCLALAQERDVDLVTIGGDLWEEEHVRADTRRSVAYELDKFGRPVILVCGNHDPLLPGGSYMRTEWPENVTILRRGRLDEQRFASVSFWGISWGGGDLPGNLLDTAQAPDDGRIHVLLLHGTARPLAGVVGEPYFPFDPARVAEAGFALCLAGHVHVAREIGLVVYPGSPEPLGWGEEGRHCVAVAEFGKGDPKVELVDVNASRYETRKLDCTGCESSAEIQDRLIQALTDPDAGSIFLRLRIAGEIGAECELDPARLARSHEGRYGALVIEDATEPLLDITRRAERRGLEGSFVRRLLEQLAAADGDAERRRIELALQAGVRALDGREDVLHVD